MRRNNIFWMMLVIANLLVVSAFVGTAEEPNSSEDYIVLSVGWNMIGCTYDTTASSLAEDINGCEMVSCFDGAEQTYETFIVGGPPQFDFPIMSGMGLFVLVDESSMWYAGSGDDRHLSSRCQPFWE